MSVVRVNKNANYTVMSNYHFKDKRISLKAKGLLSQMLSLPDDWDYTVAGLCAINKENETAINGALKELKEYGYLIVTKKMPNETNSGRIEYIYDIYEHPTDIQQGEKQEVENLGVEFLQLEYQGQLNTNQLNTKELNTNNKNTWFNEFWNEYIKKVGKADAEKKFKKACTNENVFNQIMQALRKQNKESYSKREKQYVPNPSTWLNQRRWEDEIIQESKSNIIIEMPDFIRDQENGIKKESRPASEELLKQIKEMQSTMK